MKRPKENVHAIQVGCQLYEGAHLDKEYPFNEEVKSVEEVMYGEFGRSSPFSNGAKYHMGLPGYYTRIDNHPLFGEKRLSLEELLNKHLEESTRRRANIEEWEKKLQENMAVYTNDEAPSDNISSIKTNEVSFNKAHVAQEEDDVLTKVLSCQLPPKELNPGSFTLPCTVGRLNFYAMADLVEMADMTKRVPIGIVENVLLKIDKFLFPSSFMVIDMLNTRNETMSLGRPFLETIHAELMSLIKKSL
nr:hypothetical protein [Tanacetum cinerariifolium]